MKLVFSFIICWKNSLPNFPNVALIISPFVSIILEAPYYSTLYCLSMDYGLLTVCFVLGPATVVSSDAAGQHLSSVRDSETTYKGSCSPAESQTPGATCHLSSDSDSIESGDTKTTKDTESELSVSSILNKQRDFANLKTPSPLPRQSLDGPDNYIAKTMAWDSMDSEYSEFSDSSVVDQHEQLRRISETSIEYTPRLTHAWESLSSDGTVCTDQTSTPAGDGDTLSDATVRASLASLPRDSDLGDDSSDHNGSRSSPDLSGRGRV